MSVYYGSTRYTDGNNSVATATGGPVTVNRTGNYNHIGCSARLPMAVRSPARLLQLLLAQIPLKVAKLHAKVSRILERNIQMNASSHFSYC